MSVESEPIWHGWCDGSARPNPGRLGLGGVLQAPDQTLHEFSLPGAQQGCNNEAEVRALIALLELARHHGVRRLVAWSDSDVIVRLALIPDGAEAVRLAPLFREVRALAGAFASFELRWLPQHRNQHADRLSRQALGLPPRLPAKPSRRRR